MANPDRIGSACWYQVFEQKTNSKKWLGGRVLAWSTDYEELRDGVGQSPVAIIEDEKTLACVSVHVNLVTFASVPPSV